MNLLRRFLLAFQIRAIEIHIDGCNECMGCVSDPMLLARIDLSRSRARRELAKARAEYNATLPVGKRKTWRMA